MTGRWTDSRGSDRTCPCLDCVCAGEQGQGKRDLSGVSDQEVGKMNSFGVLNTCLGSFVLRMYIMELVRLCSIYILV